MGAQRQEAQDRCRPALPWAREIALDDLFLALSQCEPLLFKNAHLNHVPIAVFGPDGLSHYAFPHKTSLPIASYGRVVEVENTKINPVEANLSKSDI